MSLFVLSSLHPSFSASILSRRKHESTSAKVTVAAEYQFQLDASTHCQGASLRERSPFVCSPQSDPPARQGERERQSERTREGKRADSDALFVQRRHGRGGLARSPTCPLMTSPPHLPSLDLSSRYGDFQTKRITQGGLSHLLLINAVRLLHTHTGKVLTINLSHWLSLTFYL